MLKTRHLLFLFIPAILIVGFVFYISILRYEPLYPEATDETAEVNEIFIPILPEDPISGSLKSNKTVVVFEDLACSACKQQSELIAELLEKHPDSFKVVWKTLSVHQFPYPTRTAHAYAYCAHEQRLFSAFTSGAFANLDKLSSTVLATLAEQIGLNREQMEGCLNSERTAAYLDTNEQIAKSLNIQSVPAIFIDNEQVPAPTHLSGWESLLAL
jgi:protein-disulfide isomerase